MTEKIIASLIDFTKSIDKKTREFINLGDNELTENITKIHDSLWNNYKDLNGTSAGFHGFSEYIIFSTFKNFIESLNVPQKFKPEEINRDLRFFELKMRNKLLRIYRSASLKHYPIELESKRAPDIAILKKEKDNFNLIAVIEIKNYLDKDSLESGIKILSEIKEASNDRNIKYALFSFSRVHVRNNQALEKLHKYLEKENCYLIIQKLDEKFKTIDLFEFFKVISCELTL